MDPQPEIQASPSAPMRLVTLRAIAISCALMPILALWVVQSELIWYSGHSTAISLFFHVTFAVFVLALVNLLIRRRWPARALTGGELMTIYMMLAVGNATLYKPNILAAWLKPLAFWWVFLLALMGALLSFNILLRKPWTEQGRLSLPVIQIPILLATGIRDLLRSKAFWIAFALTGGIDLLRSMKEERGVTVITATHDMKMLAASDRVVWITDGKISRIQRREEMDINVGSIDGKEE